MWRRILHFRGSGLHHSHVQCRSRHCRLPDSQVTLPADPRSSSRNSPAPSASRRLQTTFHSYNQHHQHRTCHQCVLSSPSSKSRCPPHMSHLAEWRPCSCSPKHTAHGGARKLCADCPNQSPANSHTNPTRSKALTSHTF